MLRRLALVALTGALAAGLLGVAPAHAATTSATNSAATSATLTFGGVTSSAMTVSNGTSTGSLPAGTPYSGVLTYGTTQGTSTAYAGGLHTTYPFTDLALTVGTSTVHSGPGVVDVYDDLAQNGSYPTGDSAYVNFTAPVAPSGALAGADFNWTGLAFLDATGRAVTGGALPDLSTAAWSNLFSEFNYGTLGTRWGAGNTSTVQPLTVTGGTWPAAVQACSGRDGVVSAYAPRTPGYLVVDGGLALLDHLWTTDLTPATTTFLGGTTTFYATGLVVSWHGTQGGDGCHLTDLTVAPAVSFATTTLPGGTVGAAYSAPVAAQWGVAPYAVSVSGLPTGLSFDGTSVVGVPAAAGTFAVTGEVVDARGAQATAAWSLVVAPAPPPVTTGGTLEGKGRVTAIGEGFSSLTIGSTVVVWDAATRVEVHLPDGSTRTVVDGAVTVGARAQWKGRRIAGTGTVLLSKLEIG